MKTLWKLLRGLFCDKGKNSLSLGRISWWILFGVSIWYWVVRDADVHPGHLTVLLSLLAYCLGTHAKDYFEEAAILKHGRGPTLDEGDGP